MVTYDFYQNTYLGTAISQGAFPRLAARAEAWLTRLERICVVRSVGPDSRAMAVCAVAETMQAMEKQQFISQASVGGVSVRYQNDPARLQRRLVENAGVYLDIYRGVC